MEHQTFPLEEVEATRQAFPSRSLSSQAELHCWNQIHGQKAFAAFAVLVVDLHRLAQADRAGPTLLTMCY